MAFYVIGNDKGLTEAYSADQIDGQMQDMANDVDTKVDAVQRNLNTTNSNLATTNNNLSSLQTTVNGKQKTITSGTGTPSGGSNGDIYIQY